MQIKLNGEEITVRNGISLNDFLKEQKYQKSSFAVAINECFVPRSQYDDIALHDDDRIDIVVAMQGG